jgi:hypothetical protein
MRISILEAFGWYGAAAILGAYALVSFGMLQADSVAYQALNVTGALGIVVVSRAKNNPQPMVLNAVWAVVGAVALVRMLA